MAHIAPQLLQPFRPFFHSIEKMLPAYPFLEQSISPAYLISQFHAKLPDNLSTHHSIALLLLALPALVLTLQKSFLFLSRVRQPATTLPGPRAIDVLLLLICPKRSLWPAAYHKIARQAQYDGSQTIVIPLEMLVGDICAGKIEFRRPQV